MFSIIYRKLSDYVRASIMKSKCKLFLFVATSTTSKPQTIPTSNMVYRFGWMKDACTGDQLDFGLLED